MYTHNMSSSTAGRYGSGNARHPFGRGRGRDGRAGCVGARLAGGEGRSPLPHRSRTVEARRANPERGGAGRGVRLRPRHGQPGAQGSGGPGISGAPPPQRDPRCGRAGAPRRSRYPDHQAGRGRDGCRIRLPASAAGAAQALGSDPRRARPRPGRGHAAPAGPARGGRAALRARGPVDRGFLGAGGARRRFRIDQRQRMAGAERAPRARRNRVGRGRGVGGGGARAGNAERRLRSFSSSGRHGTREG